MLMKISEYQKMFAPGSRPARNTVLARIHRGELIGKKEGGIWYVDPDQKPPTPTIEEAADALFEQLSAKKVA